MIWGGGPLNMATDPTNLPFMFLPASVAIGYVSVIRLTLSGSLAYLLSRKLALSRYGSLLGGLVYAFSLPNIISITFPPILEAKVWIPLVLLFVVTARQKQSIRFAAAAGAVYGYDFLIGAVDILFDLFLVISLFFVMALLYDLYRHHNRKALTTLSLFLAFVCLALIIGGPTIYGAEVQLGASSRAQEIGSVQSHTFFPPVYLSTYINPNALGGWNSFYSLNLPCCWANYVDFVHYFGLIPLYLAVLPLFVQRTFLARNKIFYFFYLVTGLSLIAALGTISPLYPLFSRIPYFYSTTVTTVLQQQELPIAMLAGLGFTIIERRVDWRKARFRFKNTVGLILFVASSVGLSILILFVTNNQIALEYSQWNGLIAIVALSIAGLGIYETLLQSNRFKPPSRRQFIGATILILIVSLDLFGYGYGWVSFNDQTSVYPATPPIQLVQSISGYSRTVSIGDFAASLPSDSGQIYQIYDPRGYSSTIPQRYLQFIESIPGFEYTQNQIVYQHYSDSSLLDLLGVRYVISPSTVAFPPPANASLTFDGMDDYVEAPSLTNVYAIEAWMYSGNYSGIPQIITIPASRSSWNSPYFEITLYSVGPKPVLGLNVNGSPYFVTNDSYSLTPNQWYDIVGTYDKTAATLYVDGTAIAQRLLPGDIQRYNQSLFVGTAIPGLGPWNGQIAYVRAYNISLSQNQVQYNYANPIGPVGTGLVLDMPLNQSSGYIAQSLSGVVGNGQIIGATWAQNDQSHLKLLLQDNNVRVYENTNAMPRTFLVHSWVVSPNETQSLKEMTSSTFDLRTSAVLEGSPRGESGACSPPNNDTTRIVSYGPDSITIGTQSACPGYLVLSDSYYDGWHATVDGVESPILPADAAFRGVFVSAGSHKVSLQYLPLTYYGLMILSWTTLALLILSTVIITVRRRKTNSPKKVAPIHFTILL